MFSLPELKIIKFKYVFVFVLLNDLILLIYVNLSKVELLVSNKNLNIVMYVLKFRQKVAINLYLTGRYF